MTNHMTKFRELRFGATYPAFGIVTYLLPEFTTFAYS